MFGSFVSVFFNSKAKQSLSRPEIPTDRNYLSIGALKRQRVIVQKNEEVRILWVLDGRWIWLRGGENAGYVAFF